MDRNTRGLSDKDIEKAWESLENEPFTTNSSGGQVLDSENGWFGFDKGTTQQEIWRWFDTHHSKGVAYLVNDYEPEENIEIQNGKENQAMENEGKTLSWADIQENADGAHWNDEVLAVKNRAKEQAAAFANETGAELNADDEDDIESFVKDYGINFLPDGTMSENRYALTSGNPQSGHDYGVQAMLAKFLEEESEKNASDNRGKEFASNFSRERFAGGDLRTIIQYANHLDDGSAQWMLGARAGNERQLYYRDPAQSGEWQKATAQEFFDFAGDFYAHNYNPEFDANNLALMSQLFPNSKEIDKLWQRHFTKDDMTIEDVNGLSGHSAHGEIWSQLPGIDDGDNPYVVLKNAVEAAASYLENNDGLKDKDFGNRSDSTEEEKATRKEFLSLLKDVNDALHSDEFHDNAFPIENATAENLDLLHAEVLKDCAALAKEDFLSSFGEIIDGEYPNQEEAEYRRHTLNELRIDEKNLDNYLDDNAPRLLENVYEKARTKSVGLYGFIEATVDTSDPAAEQEMEWNRALKELLDGYTGYKDFNEEWDVSLTPATAKLDWLESEKDLVHIALDNASGDASVEVPAGAESYKDFLDSIDSEKRFSLSNLLRAETLQMSNAKAQEQSVHKDKDMERFSAIFAGMEAPDLNGKSKDIEGLIENYRNAEGVKVPVVEAISTMLYDSPQIHGNGSYSNFGALSMENFDNKYGQDGTEARNELCGMVAEKIAADKSIKSFEQVKELMKTGSEKVLKEKLDEIAHSKEFIEKFGDWEKANRIENLKKSESLQISGKIIVHGKDETAYINELRSNPSRENLRKLTSIVTDFGKEMLQNLRLEQNLNNYASPVLTINDDGKKYHINFSGIKETSHHNLYQKGHIEGIYNIPQIIESAIYLTTEKNEDNRKPEFKQFHYYSLGIKLDDDDYTAKIVFTENRNGEIYYDQSLSTIEKGKLIDLLQTKNKPAAFNPINRRDSKGLSENESPSEYYDMRLASVCQVPQMPYLEMVNGRWQPTQEAIKAVEDGKLSVEKNGQKYIMRAESLLEEKTMEKEEPREQDSPDIATWKQLEELVGIRDFDSVKDDALEGNPGFGEREWKEEMLARCLEDGILDLRSFSTSSGSKINDLQFDPEFTKSSKWGLYEKIEPEKWRIIGGLSKDIVADRETLDNGDIGLGDIQSKYDDMLSESDVYQEAVEKELVQMDDIMADTIDQNDNIDHGSLSDTMKEKMVLAMPASPSKIERFVVTPENLKGDYSAEEMAKFLSDYRDGKDEPAVTEKQAEVIMRYLRSNEYAAAVDQKGNLKIVDFSEDFNLVDELETETLKSLVEFTEDLISKDDGFEDRTEDDLKAIKPLRDFYKKENSVQKTKSPEQLYDSFIENVEKEFKELRFLRAAAASIIRTLSPEEKKAINGELKRRGARSPETLALVVRKSIEKRHKNRERLHGRDCPERER